MSENSRTTKGYVYVLSNASYPDLYKIGFTTRDINSRVEELSSATGVPTPFKVEYAQMFKDCMQAEKYIHSILEIPGGRVSKQREFFKVPLSTIIETIKYAKKVLDDNQEVNIPEHNIDSESDIYIQEAKELYETVRLLGGEKEVENKLKKAARLKNKEAYYLLGELYLNEDLPKTYDKDKAMEMFGQSIKIDNSENPDGFTDINSEFFKKVYERALDEWRNKGSVNLILEVMSSFEHDDVSIMYTFIESFDGIDGVEGMQYVYYDLIVDKATEEQKEVAIKAAKKLIAYAIKHKDRRSMSMGGEWAKYFELKGPLNMDDDDYDMFKRDAAIHEFVHYFSNYSNLDTTRDFELFEALLLNILDENKSRGFGQEEIESIQPFINKVLYLLRDISLKNTYYSTKSKELLYRFMTGIILGSKKWVGNENDEVRIDFEGYTPPVLLREVLIECVEVKRLDESTEITVQVRQDELNANDILLITDTYDANVLDDFRKIHTIDSIFFKDEQATNLKEGSIGKLVINKRITDNELALLNNKKNAIRIVGNHSDVLPESLDTQYSVLKENDVEKEYLYDLFYDYEKYKDVSQWYQDKYNNNDKEENAALEAADLEENQDEKHQDSSDPAEEFERQLSEMKYLPSNWYYWSLATIIIYMLGDLFFFTFDLLFNVPIVGFWLGVTFFYIVALIFSEGIAQFFNYLMHKAGEDNLLGLMAYMIYLFIFIFSRASLSFVVGLINLLRNIVNSK